MMSVWGSVFSFRLWFFLFLFFQILSALGSAFVDSPEASSTLLFLTGYLLACHAVFMSPSSSISKPAIQYLWMLPGGSGYSG